MQKLVPNVWCNRNASDVADLYTTVFNGASSKVTGRYPTEGLAEFQRGFEGLPLTIDVDIRGYQISLINSDDTFAPNPSISFIVNCDPLMYDGSEQAAKEDIDRMWAALLTNGGSELMPLQEYPHSKWYGWVQDQFGVSWQLMLTDPSGDPRPFIVPQIMFAGDNDGKAQEALDLYSSVLPDARTGTVAPYPDGMRDKPGLMFAELQSGDDWLSVMDGGTDHDFTFTCGMSIEVRCDGQAEIDRLWDALSAVPEAEACGWLADKFGVSWQIIPANMAELMERPNAFENMMTMKKLVIDEI